MPETPPTDPTALEYYNLWQDAELRAEHLGRFAQEIIRDFERETGQKYRPSAEALNIYGDGNHDDTE